jgi:hypothetical protein
MTVKIAKKNKIRAGDKGIALMVVLVLLVILCALAYTLTLRVSAYRKRTAYMIDYQAARYACDSAVKYALATLQDINTPTLIARPNEPDFSDLFATDAQQYHQLLDDWARSISAEQAAKHQKKVRQFLRSAPGITDVNDTNSLSDFNNLNDANTLAALGGLLSGISDSNLSPDINDPNNLQIPGPYGPAWPLITEPLNIMIGDVYVTIEMQDENAKYPIGWLMLDDPKLQPQIQAGFETFCEWMDVNTVAVGHLEDELADLNKIKQYKLNPEDIRVVTRQRITVPSRAVSARTRRSRAPQTRYRTKTTVIPAAVGLTDLARLFHSPMINTDALARPTIIAGDRTESALKYISLWPISAVNINTAPRQVLEATFAFGGLTSAVPLADNVIQRRRIKPFDDPNEMRQEFFRYGDSLDKCRQYIVTKSDFFTIHVSAKRGLAHASAVIVVRNNNGKMEKIAVLNG